SNHDNLIDEYDTHFQDLQIWKDVNSDGVSDADELFSLSELNIESISLDSQSEFIDLGGGNQSVAQGTFTWTDGSNSTAGAAESLDLSFNGFYREFTDEIEIPPELEHLPDTSGSGALRDLREAAVLHLPLASTLEGYSSAQTRENQLALLDQLIDDWAESSDYEFFNERFASNTVEGMDVEFRFYKDLSAQGGVSTDLLADTYSADQLLVGSHTYSETIEFLEKLRVLEAFNDQSLIQIDFSSSTSSNNYRFELLVGSLQLFGNAELIDGTLYVTDEMFSGSERLFGIIDRTYDSLRQSLYNQLLPQTRLGPYLDQISYGTDAEGAVVIDTTAFKTFVTQQLTQDKLGTTIDVLELLSTSGSALVEDGFDDLALYGATLIANLDAGERDALKALFPSADMRNSYGGLISFDAPNSHLDSATSIALGNQTLWGSDQHIDIVFGGAKRDHISTFAGTDILSGGTESDYLQGGDGNDVYLYFRGDNEIKISDHSDAETIVLGADISLSELAVARRRGDLIITFDESPDDIIVLPGNFDNYQDHSEHYSLVVQGEKVSLMQLIESQGTIPVIDSVRGTDQANVMEGSTLYGEGGDDTLTGTDGDDGLHGGAGDDQLLGLGGSDFLDGGEGNDRYYLTGAGDTVISDYDGGDQFIGEENTLTEDRGHFDIVEFLAPIEPADVVFELVGSDLVMTIASTGGTVTIKHYLNTNGSHGYSIDKFIFSDGTEWSEQYIADQLVLSGIEYDGNGIFHYYGGDSSDQLNGSDLRDRLYGRDGDDTLSGGLGNDVLYGGAGDDTLDGEAGVDMLFGGAGNDVLIASDTSTLIGGDGNDTYEYRLGDGNVSIRNQNASSSSRDTLKLIGISQNDVSISRTGTTFFVTILSTNDEIELLVENWSGDSQLPDIEFEGGDTLTREDLAKITWDKRNGSGFVYGTDGDDVIGSEFIGHQIFGMDGNDQITGTSEADNIQGGDGDDTLIGLEGNDSLRGGKGSNTYSYGIGMGYDTLQYSAEDNEHFDTLELTGGLSQNDVEIVRFYSDLRVILKSTGEYLTVKEFFSEGVNTVNVIHFDDNSTIDVPTIESLVAEGNDADQHLVGGNNWELIDGQGGDDRIEGLSGYDRLFGGDGEDSLYGGDGHDYLDGGEDDDRLEGGADSDTLVGGVGSDILIGGSGDDTYFYRYGDGSDIIYNSDDGESFDRVVFDEGILPEDVVAIRDLNNLRLEIVTSGESITVSDFFKTREIIGYEEIPPLQVVATLPGGIVIVRHPETGEEVDMADLDLGGPIYGGAKNYIDEVVFATGDKWTYQDLMDSSNGATELADHLIGTAEDDVMDGLSGDDKLFSLEGNDTVYGRDGDDLIYGRFGDDQLFGGNDDDDIYGGDGNDYLDDGQGNDYLNGEDGDDILIASSGEDWLDGGNGNDILASNAGRNWLNGGEGNDRYEISALTEFAYITEDSDRAESFDTLVFGPGITEEDVRFTRYDVDGLSIETSDGLTQVILDDFFDLDWSMENRVIDSIEFSSGTIWSLPEILDRATAPTENDDDIMAPGDEDSTLVGLGGNDSLHGRGGNDSIFGGEGNDNLRGGAGDDLLAGGAGDDDLEGGDGNDVLNGDSGTDTLEGGSGDDVYIVGLNNSVRITDSSSSVNILQLVDGISPEDIRSYKDGNGGLHLVLDSTGNEIVVENQFDWQDPEAPSPIDSIHFDSGEVWDASDLKDLVTKGSGLADVLSGFSTTDLLQGFAGNDVIYGNGGDDVIEGGAGDDEIWGGLGIETITGGAGDDTINSGYSDSFYHYSLGDGSDVYDSSGKDGYNVLIFGEGITAGDLQLKVESNGDLKITVIPTMSVITAKEQFKNEYANWHEFDEIRFHDGEVWTINEILEQTRKGSELADVLTGSSGDDALLGLGGNDQLFGLAGSDLLDGGTGDDLLQGGAGDDTYRFAIGDGTDVVAIDKDRAGEMDVIEFDSSVSKQDVAFDRDAQNLIVSYDGSSSITVNGFFETPEAELDRIVFDNGDSISNSEIRDLIRQQVTTSLTLNGSGGSDYMEGAGGNDVFDAKGGDDQLYGFGGDDSLTGGGGDDHLYGGAGADVLLGGSGNDHIYAGAGNDLAINGYTGDDTYYFGLGDGNNSINNNDSDASSLDKVVFLAGVVPEEVMVSKSGNHLLFHLTQSGETLTVSNYYSNEKSKIDQVEFSGGEVWDQSLIEQRILLGTNGDDSLVGTANDDVLTGQIGTDTLDGGAGNDQLSGGEGNDLLIGGAGNDTYLYESGHGDDVVSMQDQSLTDIDSLILGDGLLSTNTTLTKVGGDLVIGFSDQSGSITVQSHFVDTQYEMDSINFEGGEIWDAAYIAANYTSSDEPLNLVGTGSADILQGAGGDDALDGKGGSDTLYGEAGNDTLIGGGGADYLYGGEGADILKGSGGNDHFYGGAGNDIHTGGNGHDTYYFLSGDGYDKINNGSSSYATNTDKLDVDSSVSINDLWFKKTNNHLDIYLLGSSDQIRVNNWYKADKFRLDEIDVGSASIDTANIEQLVSTMAAFGAPSGGSISLTTEEQQQVDNAIAAAWS
ncbi:MAG: hypothetical protein C9356_19880, partial [Oleiphilus sp.]